MAGKWICFIRVSLPCNRHVFLFQSPKNIMIVTPQCLFWSPKHIHPPKAICRSSICCYTDTASAKALVVVWCLSLRSTTRQWISGVIYLALYSLPSSHALHLFHSMWVFIVVPVIVLTCPVWFIAPFSWSHAPWSYCIHDILLGSIKVPFLFICLSYFHLSFASYNQVFHRHSGKVFSPWTKRKGATWKEQVQCHWQRFHLECRTTLASLYSLQHLSLSLNTMAFIVILYQRYAIWSLPL